MNETLHTLDGPVPSTLRGAHAFLVIHVDAKGPVDVPSRVVELADGQELTFGRSRSATVTVDDDRVSRIHARLKRTGDAIEIEDLNSRNGTRVNGEKILGVLRLASGDEILIGPIQAVVGMTSNLRRASAIAGVAAGEARLVAEVDRSVRYHRPLTMAIVRCRQDEMVDSFARSVRAMDLIAEDAADDYLVILPELSRSEGVAALERLVELANAADVEVRAGAAQCPDDGTTVEALIGVARAALRAGKPLAAAAAAAASMTTLVVADHESLVIDAAMKRVYALVDRIADTAMTVLIVGESGVGKELVCEAVHARSGRSARALVKVNCAAMTEAALDTELFGDGGAHAGVFAAAGGGTVFLDQVGELPAALQGKLLSSLERTSGVRLVAATSRDLEADAKVGRFRQDLLYRLGAFTVVVPPLRDRASEILPLAEHFARLTAHELGRPVPALSDEAREALAGYTWPGNVRELRNAIERALVLCTDTITPADLPDKLRDAAQRTRPVVPTSSMRGHLEEIERAAIVSALDTEHGNQTRAARRLGLSRRALIYKMEKYGLKPPPGQGVTGG